MKSCKHVGNVHRYCQTDLTRHLYSKHFSCYFVFHFLAARVFRRQKQLQLTQFHLYCCTSASFISCVWHSLSTISPSHPPWQYSHSPSPFHSDTPLPQYSRQPFACVIIVSDRLTNCHLQTIKLNYCLYMFSQVLKLIFV